MVITEPGQYELIADIDGDGGGTCIEVRETSGVVLDGNGYSLTNVRVGIAVHGSHEVRVGGMEIADAGTDGVSITNSEAVTVHNSSISGVGRDGIFVDGSSEVIFSASRIEHAGRYGVNIESDRTSNVDAVGNTVRNVGEVGLRAADTEGVQFRENTLIETGYGIQSTDSSNLLIEGNRIEQQVYAVQINDRSTDVTVRANEMVDSSLCAMEVTDNATAIVIEDNSLRNNHGLAIKHSVSDITIRNNVLEDSTVSGLGVVDHASDIRIYGNEITNSFRHGITIQDDVTAVDVWDNTLRSNRGFGIDMQNSVRGVAIDENVIDDNRGGVRLHATHDVAIESNEITDNDGPAIELTESFDVRVHNNEFVGNEWGITVDELSDPVKATENWWGDVSGPSGSGPGEGDRVSENVEFDPWLAPQLSIVETSIESESLAVGDTMRVVVDVKNVGEVDTKLGLELRFDDDVVAVEDVTLAAGEEHTVTFDHRMVNAGNATVYVGDEAIGEVAVEDEGLQSSNTDDDSGAEGPAFEEDTTRSSEPGVDDLSGFHLVAVAIGLLLVIVATSRRRTA